MTESVPSKEPVKGLHILVVVAIVYVIVQTAIGAITLYSVYDNRDSVNFGNCRALQAQETQEEFRVDLGHLLAFSFAGDRDGARSVADDINNATPYADRVKREC